MASKKKSTKPQSLSPMEKALKNAVSEERAGRRAVGKTKTGDARKDVGEEEAPDYTGFLERQKTGTGVQLGPRKPRYRETTPSPVGNTGRTPAELEMRKTTAEAAVKGRTVTKTRKAKGKTVEVSKKIPPSVPLTLKAARENRRFWFGAEAGPDRVDDVSPETLFETTEKGTISDYKGIRRNAFNTVPGSTRTKQLEREKASTSGFAEDVRALADIISEVPETVPTGDYLLRDVSRPDEKPQPGPVAELRPGRLGDIATEELNKRLTRVSSRLSNKGQSVGQAPGNQVVRRNNAGILTEGTVDYLRANVVGEATTGPTPSSAFSRRSQTAPVSAQLREFAEKLDTEAASIPDVYDPETQGVKFYGGYSAEEMAETPADLAAIKEDVATKGKKRSRVVMGPKPVIGEGATAPAPEKTGETLDVVNESLMKIKNVNVRKRRAKEYVDFANTPGGFPVRKSAETAGVFVPGSSKIVATPSTTSTGTPAAGERYSRALTPEERAKVSEAKDKPGSPASQRRAIKKVRKSMGIPKQSAPMDERTQSIQRRTMRDVASQIMADYPGRGGGDEATAAYAEMAGEAANNPSTAGIIASKPAKKSWVGPTGTIDLKTQTLKDEDMAKLRVSNPNLASMFDRVSGKGAVRKMAAGSPEALESQARSDELRSRIEASKTPLPMSAADEGFTPAPATREQKRQAKEAKAVTIARAKFTSQPAAKQESVRQSLYIQEPSVERSRDLGMASSIKDYAEYSGKLYRDSPAFPLTNKSGEMVLREKDVAGLPREDITKKIVATQSFRSQGYGRAPLSSGGYSMSDVYDPKNLGFGRSPNVSTAPLAEQPTKGSEPEAPSLRQKYNQSLERTSGKIADVQSPTGVYGPMNGDQWNKLPKRRSVD